MSYNYEDDEELKRALRNKDKGAISFIFDNYLEPCSRIILNDGGYIDDAKEVFHESISSLLEKLERIDFEIKSSPKGYIYRTCFHLWVSKKNKSRKINSLDTETSIEIEDDSDEALERLAEKEENYTILYKCMEQLTPECKQSIELFYLKRMKDKEIAKELDYSLQFTKQKRRRCIQKVRACAEKSINLPHG